MRFSHFTHPIAFEPSQGGFFRDLEYDSWYQKSGTAADECDMNRKPFNVQTIQER